MSHYNYTPPTKEERKKRRERKQARRKAVQKVFNLGALEGVEQFIQEQEKARHNEILEFIQDEYIDEDWLDDRIESISVARKVFFECKHKSKRKARHGKGMPEEPFIREKTDTWYELEKVELR